MPRQQGRASEGKDPAENGYSPAGNRCGREHKRGRLTERQVSRREKQADRETDRQAEKQTGRRRSGSSSNKKQGDAARRAASPLLRDSGAVRTLDPQLRRLLLYPTELRNHRRAGPESPVCGCKYTKTRPIPDKFKRNNTIGRGKSGCGRPCDTIRRDYPTVFRWRRKEPPPGVAGRVQVQPSGRGRRTDRFIGTRTPGWHLPHRTKRSSSGRSGHAATPIREHGAENAEDGKGGPSSHNAAGRHPAGCNPTNRTSPTGATPCPKPRKSQRTPAAVDAASGVLFQNQTVRFPRDRSGATASCSWARARRSPSFRTEGS